MDNKKIEENVVYVGSKPPGVYAFSVKTIFNKGIGEVILKARGRSIITAINIVEFMKRNKQLEIKDIKISSTEHFKHEDEKEKIFVSSIEITVKNI